MSIFCDCKQKGGALNFWVSSMKPLGVALLLGFSVLEKANAHEDGASLSQEITQTAEPENIAPNKKGNDDAFPQEDMPLSPTKEKYLKELVERTYSEKIRKPPYTRDWLIILANVVREKNNFSLANHLEFREYFNFLFGVFENECHQDIEVFKDKLRSLWAENEAKKQRWNEYLDAHPKEKAKLNESSIKFTIERKTKLPVLEELYLSKLIADAQHPDFVFVSGIRGNAARWLVYYADEMKKSGDCTPKNAKEINKILKKYQNILSNDCKKDAEQFKTKILDIYKNAEK